MYFQLTSISLFNDPKLRHSLRPSRFKCTQIKIIYKHIPQLRLYLLSIQIRSNIYIHYIYKRKKKCTVGCTITTFIYSSEVSTNLPNYKSQKSIKIFKKSSVICKTRVGCSNFHVSSIYPKTYNSVWVPFTRVHLTR